MELPDQTHDYIYELVGILLHAGTAESGHYIFIFLKDLHTNNQLVGSNSTMILSAALRPLIRGPRFI